MQVELGTRVLDLSTPVIMGVLNVTPDSFSDGGRYAGTADAVRHARRLEAEGAAIVDVGGESSRPGASEVPVAEEMRRVLPVVEAVARESGATVSVDTAKPEVMRAAIRAGAHLINDINALRAPGALDVCAAGGVGVCLMHMQGTPRTMQAEPRYADVVSEVFDFLAARVEACVAAGIGRERVLIDPGFGFGKTLQHNLELLGHLECFHALGVPVLAGLSRKSMLAALTGREVGERLAGSLALATLAVARGASIIRTHEVAATLDAVKVAAALRRGI